MGRELKKRTICAAITVVTMLCTAVSASAAISRVMGVLWQGDPQKPHTAISGTPVRLKAVIKTTNTSTIYYKWIFGDGTESAVASVRGSKKHNVETSHSYTGATGTPFTATILVDVTNTLVSPVSSNYLIRIEEDSINARVNLAIDKGLWWLYKNANTDSCSKRGRLRTLNSTPFMVWHQSGMFWASPTASAIQAFAVNNHKATGNPNEDPYVEAVQHGLNWLTNGYYKNMRYPMLQTVPIGVRNGVDPEAGQQEPNGLGIQVRDYGYFPVHEGGQVMEAIIASGVKPEDSTGRDFSRRGSAWTFQELFQDMCDMYAYGQYGKGTYGSHGVLGGWSYKWGEWPNNFASQWAAMGMIAAQQPPWNCIVPDWVKTYNGNWLEYSYSSGHFGYHRGDESFGSFFSTTFSGMVQMDFVGQIGYDDPATEQDERNAKWIGAERYLADNWSTILHKQSSWEGNLTSGWYGFAKAMRLAVPNPVETIRETNGTQFNWYYGDASHEGLAQRIIETQELDGRWIGNWAEPPLTTAWMIITLKPSLFTESPIACFTTHPNPGYVDQSVAFDPSCSGHSEPGKTIHNLVSFEWDWDSNGVYDTVTPTPEVVSHSFPCDSLPCTYRVTLKVTDDSSPALTTTYRLDVRISDPPHSPVADAGGPYRVSLCPRDSLRLDGSKSFDPDEGRHEAGCNACPDDTIISWSWDLKEPLTDFSDKSGKAVIIPSGTDPGSLSSYFDSAGPWTIGLRVMDNTKLSYPGSGQDNLTDINFGAVQVDGCCDPDLNLATQATGRGKVRLSWTLTGAASYDILRSKDTPNSGFSLIKDNCLPQEMPYIDSSSDLALGTLYTYRVVTSDGCGSAPSSATPQCAPIDLTGVNQPDGKVVLNWTPSCDDLSSCAQSYSICRSVANPPNPATDSIATVAAPPYEDSGLNSGITYFYEVVSSDGCVSNVVSVAANARPIANAGPDQTVLVGRSVFLDAGGSSDADGDPLTYSWSLVSRPEGSSAVLFDPAAVRPSFVPDLHGSYTIELVVSDGELSSSPDTVIVSTLNSTPVAEAGPDQAVHVGETALLDGTASSDADSDPLSYQWSFSSKPAGSAAMLSDSAAEKPSFHVDVAGAYVVQLIVSDGKLSSAPDAVVIATINRKPAANAGPDQAVNTGETVHLDGGSSSDPDGDTLTWSWTFISRPSGSTAALSGASTVSPSFIADVTGPYVVQLIVSDGMLASEPAVVTVTATGPVLVTVPSVVGMIQTDAESAITSAGLSVGAVTTETSPTVPAGQVMSQSPPGGADVAPGSSVALVVSLGPGEPVLVSMSADPPTITVGQSATLSWTSSNADSCVIDNGIGAVPLNGTVSVSPAETTTYAITATGGSGTATASATVSVRQPVPGVTISADQTSLAVPGRVVLSWTSTDVTSCSIDQSIGAVPLSGSMAVFLDETTRFTITAIGPGGTYTGDVTVTVENAAPLATLSASPETIPVGAQSTLTWTSTNASLCSIDPGVGSVASSGSIQVSPSETTVYTLTVTGPGGAVTARVRVYVGDAYSYGDPTIAEQVHLEAINRARMNPQAEAVRLGIDLNEGLAAGTISADPRQPLVFNARLVQAARLHSQDMLDNQFYSHNSSDGRTPYDRIFQTGYRPMTWDENIGSTLWSSPLDPIAEALALHDALFIDADVSGRGHRLTILNGDLKEAGAGFSYGAFYGAPYAVLLTDDFASSMTEPNLFLTGVVYDDRNGDGIYTAGEGVGDVEIHVVQPAAKTLTCTTGGYGILLAPGTYTVEARLSDGRFGQKQVTLTDRNVKADFLLGEIILSGPSTEAGLSASPQIVVVGGSATLSWSSTYATSCSIEPGVGGVGLNGSVVVTPAATTTYRITAVGPKGTATSEATVYVYDPARPVEATLSAAPEEIENGDSATLFWSSTNATEVSIDNGIGKVALNGSLSVRPGGTTTYTVRASNPSGSVVAQARVVVRVNRALQPVGSFGARYESLIPGDSSLEVYSPERFAVLTGLVQDGAGSPLAGVRVRVLTRPDYGSALTDEQGRFSLPVEGGSAFTLSFEQEGLLPAQRQVKAAWNDIRVVETVVLIEPDPVATTITLNGDPEAVLTHRSSETTDSLGTRSCTMVFSGDNQAFEVDGLGNVVRQMSTLTLRATEYRSAESMPAKLPPNAGFAYSTELQVDGASKVEFHKPVVVWVENFLGFGVGQAVPVGYYDRERGVWVPSENGRVVRLLDRDSDAVVDALDADGDGLPDDLNANGQISDEVKGLGDPSLYPVGSTFYRVEVGHFSGWSISWPFGIETGGAPPTPLAVPFVDLQKTEGRDDSSADLLVEDRSRILHEDLPIAGTGLSLHYVSNRVKGYRYTINVPLSGSELPSGLLYIRAEMSVAGRTQSFVFSPAQNLEATFSWDGLDYLGREYPGPDPSTAHIRIGYVYPGVYELAEEGAFYKSFAQHGRTLTAVLSRENMIFWEDKDVVIHRYRMKDMAEGWGLSARHQMSRTDPATLLRGDGLIRHNESYIIQTIAGTGEAGYGGDGGAAVNARLSVPAGACVDSAGNVFFADRDNHVVRRIDTEGNISTVAGSGVRGFEGDGGPATSAKLDTPTDVSVDEAGNLFIADALNNRIRKVSPSGLIATVAGRDDAGELGDNGPATEASLDIPIAVSTDGRGSLFIADMNHHRIRKVDASGGITTVAGGGQSGEDFCGDHGPAMDACLYYPGDVRVDRSGNLYIADTSNHRVRKVDTSGTIRTIAGTGEPGYNGDGLQGELAQVYAPKRIAVDDEENVFLIEGSCRLRKVNKEGIITTVAGTGCTGNYDGDEGPPSRAERIGPYGVALGPLGRIYLTDSLANTISRISHPTSSSAATGNSTLAFVEDGVLGQIMTEKGVHTHTTDLATGLVVLEFENDTEDRLLSIKDQFGNRTVIERDGSGTPTAIVSPYGLRTALEIDSSNNLIGVSYPDGSGVDLEYIEGGLLSARTDARGKRYEYSYDEEGKLKGVVDPNGGSRLYTRPGEYATIGKMVTSVSTPQGNVTSYEDSVSSTGLYEGLVKDAANAWLNLSLNVEKTTGTASTGCGMSMEQDYAIDVPYRYRYPSKARISTAQGLSKSILYEKQYDNWEQAGTGNRIPRLITELTTVNGKTARLENDTALSRKTLTSPMGRQSTTTYGPSTLLPETVSVPGLYDTHYSYDSSGRPTEIRVGERRSRFTYDAKGNLESATTPDNKTSTFECDAVGRLKVAHRPDTNTIRYEYDENGNLTVLTTPSSVAHGFGYNALNQQDSYLTPLSGEYESHFNKDGDLEWIRFPSGKEIRNTYERGRLKLVETPETSLSLTYKECGNLLESLSTGTESISYDYDGSLLISESRSGTLNQAIGYIRNNDFQVREMSYAGESGVFEYDNDGLLTRAGAFTISRKAENGLPDALTDGTISIARDFSGFAELDRQSTTVGARNVSTYSLTRDASGRIETRTETLDGTTIDYGYEYDEVGRLVRVEREGVLVEEYRYDANGTRIWESNALRGITRTLTSSVEDQCLIAGETTYQTNNDGFLQSKTTPDGTTTYTYSSRGELLKVVLPDATVIEYVHDPLNRRIARKVDGTIREKYLWQGGTRLLAVFDGSNNLLMRFNYADDRLPVSMQRGGLLYYLIADHVGSLRAVVDPSGTVVKSMDYDSFGNILTDTNPLFEIPLGFAGGLHDRDTNLVRFGARDYDPDTGRWTAKDPIFFAGGDANLYGYAQNDPVNSVDPWGLMRLYGYANRGREKWIIDFQFVFDPLADSAVERIARRFWIIGKVESLIDKIRTKPVGPLHPKRDFIACGKLDSKLSDEYRARFGNNGVSDRISKDDALRFLQDMSVKYPQMKSLYLLPQQMLDQAEQNAKSGWFYRLIPNPEGD